MFSRRSPLKGSTQNDQRTLFLDFIQFCSIFVYAANQENPVMAQAAYLCEEERDGFAFVPTDVLAPTLSVFGDADRLAPLVEDGRRGGFAVRGARPLGDLLAGEGGALGDVVIAECSAIGPGDCAALVRLDERATRAGVQVLALTSLAALDTAFGCFEGRGVRFLVDPTPAQVALALGEARLSLSQSRVREADDSERLELLRLSEEVARLAAKLDRLAVPLGEERQGSLTARLASPGIGYRAGDDRDLLRRPRAPLPDPRLVHQIVRQRRLRDRYFEPGLFADPAWDILLDLTAARAEHRRVCVTSLCIAASVPATTALRWIGQMTEMGLLVREQDPEDKRRVFIALADSVADAMARYFDELGKDAAKLI
jgi:hypothetical protein